MQNIHEKTNGNRFTLFYDLTEQCLRIRFKKTQSAEIGRDIHFLCIYSRGINKGIGSGGRFHLALAYETFDSR